MSVTAGEAHRLTFVLGDAGSGAAEHAAALAQASGAALVPGGSGVFARGVAPLVGNFDVGIDNGLRALVARDELVAAARALVTDLLLAPVDPGQGVVDHSPDDLRHSALITEVCPGARVDLVVRDGREVAASQPTWGAAVAASRRWVRVHRALVTPMMPPALRIVRSDDTEASAPRRGHRWRRALVEAMGADVLHALGFVPAGGAGAAMRRAAARACVRAVRWK